MVSRIGIVAAVCVLTIACGSTEGGEFDRIEGDVIARLIKEGGAQSHKRLTIGEIDALPTVLKESRSAFLLVKTGQGNYSRVLAVAALRKMPRSNSAALPVLLLEKFDTFEPGKSSSRVTRGTGMVLFDGFEVDLDSGVVVPAGQGGDLVFRARGEGGPRLEPLAGASLFSLTKPIPSATTSEGPSPGKAVLAGDFTGRYKLFSDGRWSGLLELKVGERKQVVGNFRSEPSGSSYEVQGELSGDPPNNVTFRIKFPRTEQEYVGYLWTEGKWGLAGTFTMLDRTFGFFAIREGAKAGIGD